MATVSSGVSVCHLAPQRSVFIALAICTIALGLGACTSNQNKTQENIRSSVRTAPADLQLTCSTETATRLQITGEQLLPISSSEISPNIFRVDFNTRGGPAYCIVDQSGTVLSVERVASTPAPAPARSS